MPIILIKQFLIDEEGAVTVDWVVLTAAVVGLSIAIVLAIQAGAADTSRGISQSLANASLRSIEF